MCGIAGIIAFHPDGKKYFPQFPAALQTLAQRGPDNGNTLQWENILLGHRRLSIIDLSDQASQPMTLQDRYSIVFNGEIFNFSQLKNELAALGYSFNTQSDTEVLLTAYIQWGSECLHKLNGFFSFAIHDRIKNEIFLARDRFGIKPLVYFYSESAFMFASELKALVKLGIPRKLNKAVLPTYFSMGYIPAPHSIYEQVNKLLPGHYLHFSTQHSSAPAPVRYYDPSIYTAATSFSYQEACQQLHTLISDAVKIRLIGDVPVGAFLSGGIDSSIVCAAAARHTANLHTFSIGFSDMPYLDESKYASHTASHLGTHHTTFQLSSTEMASCLLPALQYLDEPFADSSALAVYALSQQVSSRVTVSLSGDGGDELFAGYRKHKAEWMLRNKPLYRAAGKIIYPFVKGLGGSRENSLADKLRKIRKFASLAHQPPHQRYISLASFVNPAHSLYPGPLIPQHRQITGSDKGINDMLLNDLEWVLPNDMLHKTDMMSMANSLEVRVPLLDYRIVNFALSLPSSFKTDGVHMKKILWDSYSQYLPAEIYSRPKKGFEVPLLHWLKGPMQPLLNELTSNKMLEHQLFNPEELNILKKGLEHGGVPDLEFRLWALLVFQHWFVSNYPTI